MSELVNITYSDYYPPLLQPITEESPCGENLDYDPAFILLQSNMQPKQDIEYGAFFEAAEPINWAETERECHQLLQKSKDIRLIIILMRCRMRKIGLAALPEGLEALRALLLNWPDKLWPQLYDEGDFDPVLRANAIAELEDSTGFLGDFRNQALPRASGLQITVKEFERAHIVPREEGALSENTVVALLNDWHQHSASDIQPLIQADNWLQDIKKILTDSLGHDAPELNILGHLLHLFNRVPAADNTQAAAEMTPGNTADDGHPTALAAQRQSGGISSRSDALRYLEEVRRWFETTEPGSPLILLLNYAEQSIGKSFVDLVKMYPPEVIALLDKDKE